LDKSEFERALKSGLGRAVLYVKEHPDVPYRDAILDVCLHTTVYDGQIEGSREVYLYDVIHSTNDYAWYRERILAAFTEMPPSEDSNYSHLFALVQHMAKQGEAEARETLYQKVREDAASGWDYARDMLDLDGIPGLVFAGSLEPIERSDWEYELIALTLIEDFPDQANEASLRAVLSEYPQFLEPLLEALRERSDPTWDERNHARLQARKDEDQAEFSFSYEELKKTIHSATMMNGTVRRTILYWARYAIENDLRQAALDLEVEQDQTRLNTLLGIFSKRQYPLEPDRLIAIATQYVDSIRERRKTVHPTLPTNIAMQALNALSLIASAKVRPFALSLMDQPHLLYWAVEMLTPNFVAEDWALLASLTERYGIPPEDYHGLGMAVRHVFKHHPSIDAVPALLNLYEYSPCSHCRCHTVESLHSIGALPDWMIRECAHDSYADTRAFVEALRM
jgi:hypothetical protein